MKNLKKVHKITNRQEAAQVSMRKMLIDQANMNQTIVQAEVIEQVSMDQTIVQAEVIEQVSTDH